MKKEEGGIMKQLEKSKKLQVAFFASVMLILFVTDFIIQGWIKKSVFEITEDDFTWMFQVDSIDCDGKEIVLKGWAFELGVSAENEKYDIILLDIDSDKRYYPQMEYLLREDVNEYFSCEYDYSKTGFVASISAKKLNVSQGRYEVLIRPKDTRTAYRTGIYYVDGDMMFVDPNTFVPLDLRGTELERIVENAVLRVYRPDISMYVYQNENELFWIAENEYGFIDGDSYIQYQMNTTQVDNLPKNRIEQGYYWSNIGFDFSENEIIDMNTEKYRVAKKSIPTEYSVTIVTTGNYIEEWLWKEQFRPWFDFE